MADNFEGQDFDSLVADAEPVKMAEGGASAASAEGMDFDSLKPDAPIHPAPGHNVEGMDFDSLQSDQEHFGTPSEMAKTALEGAAQGVLGPIAPIAEKALGVPEENIRARAEVNPLTHGAGEVAGLAGSMLGGPLAGVGGAAVKAGEAGAKLLGVGEGASLVSKIGSAAVKGAIENAVMSGSDEAAKMVLNDPDTSVQTAMINTGLSGLIGGTISGAGAGIISPLWKSTMGGKAGEFLDALVKKAGGVEGQVPTKMADAVKQAGMEVPLEIMGAFSDAPEARHAFQTLMESSSKAGLKAQNILKEFKANAGDEIIKALGKDVKDISALSDLSEFDAGTQLKKTLAQNIKESIDPLADRFEKIKDKFSAAPLTDSIKDDIAASIANMADKEGFNLSPSAPQSKLIQKTLAELPNLKSLEDLRKYTSLISDNTNVPEMWRVGGQLKGIMRGFEESVLEHNIGAEAPELIAEHQAARDAYRGAMGTIDDLNDRLRVGKYSGPKSFLSALNDMAPEDVLRRLSPKGDAGIIGTLTEKFPQAAQELKDFHVGQMLGQSAKRAMPGESIDAKTLFRTLDKMSPEMKEFMLSPEAASKIEGIKTLLDNIPSKMNPSGTAKTLDALWDKIPGSAVGLATILSGHNPAAGLLLGKAAHYFTREAPDAARLSLLKFLGSDKPVNPSGFKSAIEFFHNAIMGTQYATRAVKGVLSDKAVIADSMMPTEKDRAKLDKMVAEVQKNPDILTKTDPDHHYYTPEHGQSEAATKANAITYLAQIRPKSTPQNPLDPKLPPSSTDKAAYNRVLDIAQQPLVVLKRLKDGSINTVDVTAMAKMYPALYQKLSKDLSDAIIDHVSKGKTIPYKTKMGAAMFTGQPMDSTMTPQSISAAQPTPVATPQQQAQKPSKGSKSSPALQRMPSRYQTQDQAAEAEKLKH